MSLDDPGPSGTVAPARFETSPTIPHPPIRWCRRPGWAHRVLDDEVLLLGADRELVTLTGLATPVWVVLDQPGSTAEVTERITRQWPTRPVDAEAVAEAMSLLVDGAVLAEFEPGAARVWGVADGGGVLEVVVARPLLPELARRWPPLGLRATVEQPAGPGPIQARLGLGRSGLFVPDSLNRTINFPDYTEDELVHIFLGLGEKHRYQLSDDAHESAWGVLEQSLTSIAVAQLDHLVAVHAAVIAHHGVAMLVPATSGAGKSTLTAAAARAGATVLSDEYALVDPATGLVTGWPRPVRLRRPDGTEERVDLAEPSEPLPVGLVASVTYRPGTTNDWVPAGASEVVLDLLANTIVARTRPDAALDAALAVSRNARAVTGTRGDADEAVAALLALLDRPGDEPGDEPGR